MNLSKVKLVITDMDGTLLNSKGEVSDDFYPLLEKLRKKNILFSVASGRQYYSLIAKMHKVKKDILFLAENGAIVMQNEVQKHIEPIAPKIALDLIKTIKETEGGIYLILCGKKTAYIEDTAPEFMKPFLEHYDKYKVVDDLTKVEDDEFLKVTVCDLSGAEKNTWPQVKHLKDEFQVKLSGKIWIDFTHKNAHKGNALKKIQELANIGPEHTLAFGDYLNDIELFDHAAYSFAMANAHPEAKQAAKYTTKSNDDQGVEEILRKLLDDLEKRE